MWRVITYGWITDGTILGTNVLALRPSVRYSERNNDVGVLRKLFRCRTRMPITEVSDQTFVGVVITVVAVITSAGCTTISRSDWCSWSWWCDWCSGSYSSSTAAAIVWLAFAVAMFRTGSAVSPFGTAHTRIGTDTISGILVTARSDLTRAAPSRYFRLRRIGNRCRFRDGLRDGRRWCEGRSRSRFTGNCNLGAIPEQFRIGTICKVRITDPSDFFSRGGHCPAARQ